MASVTKLIKDFARSQRGQQLVEQVKEQARKAENRRKLEELRKRYGKGRQRRCRRRLTVPRLRSTTALPTLDRHSSLVTRPVG